MSLQVSCNATQVVTVSILFNMEMFVLSKINIYCNSFHMMLRNELLKKQLEAGHLIECITQAGRAAPSR